MSRSPPPLPWWCPPPLPIRLFLLAILLGGAALGCDSSGRLDADRCTGPSAESSSDAPASDDPTEVDVETSQIVLTVSGSTIEFAVSETGFVKLTLHNSRGQRVQKLLSECVEGNVTYRLRPQPTGLSIGVYAVRLRFEDQTRTASLRVPPQ